MDDKLNVKPSVYYYQSQKKNKLPAWVRTLLFINLGVIIPIAVLFITIKLGNDSKVVYEKMISTSDVIPIHESMSKVWCKGQRLSTKKGSKFNVYITKNSKEHPTEKKIYKFHKEIKLFRGDGVSLHFFLMEGSTMKLGVCPQLSGAVINVVKGDKKFKDCTYQISESSKDGDSFEFEDYLTGESSSVSSSEQAVLLNPEMSMTCNLSIISEELKRSGKCDYVNQTSNHFTVVANSTDSYYVLFSSRNVLDVTPNNILIDVELNKTVFDLQGLKPRYLNVSISEVAYQIGSTKNTLVEIPYQSLDTLDVDVLTSNCVPRRFLYLFLLVPVLIMIMVAGFFL